MSRFPTSISEPPAAAQKTAAATGPDDRPTHQSAIQPLVRCLVRRTEPAPVLLRGSAAGLCGPARSTPSHSVRTGRDLMATAVTGQQDRRLSPIMNRTAGGAQRPARQPARRPARPHPGAHAGLAVQILDHFGAWPPAPACGAPPCTAACPQGAGRAPRLGVDVLVATPGRLLDHLRHPYAKMGRLECSPGRGGPHAGHGVHPRHPADPGSRLPVERQTMLFSATLPETIMRPGPADAPRSGRDPHRAATRPGPWHHPPRLRGSDRIEDPPAGEILRRDAPAGSRLHPHAASGEPHGGLRPPGVRCRGFTAQPQPGPGGTRR